MDPSDKCAWKKKGNPPPITYRGDKYVCTIMFPSLCVCMRLFLRRRLCVTTSEKAQWEC